MKRAKLKEQILDARAQLICLAFFGSDIERSEKRAKLESRIARLRDELEKESES